MALAAVCFVLMLWWLTLLDTSCLVCPNLLGGDLWGPGGPVAAWVEHLNLIKFFCGLFCLDFMGVGCLGCVGLEVGL